MVSGSLILIEFCCLWTDMYATRTQRTRKDVHVLFVLAIFSGLVVKLAHTWICSVSS